MVTTASISSQKMIEAAKLELRSILELIKQQPPQTHRDLIAKLRAATTLKEIQALKAELLSQEVSR